MVDDPTRQALLAAQAFNECVSRHLFSLIATTEQKGAPDAKTLIEACEHSLRASWRAGEAAAGGASLGDALARANAAFLASYLLSEQYRPLLYAAVLSRYGTTRNHHNEHRRAIDLIEAAFPDLAK